MNIEVVHEDEKWPRIAVDPVQRLMVDFSGALAKHPTRRAAGLQFINGRNPEPNQERSNLFAVKKKSREFPAIECPRETVESGMEVIFEMDKSPTKPEIAREIEIISGERAGAISMLSERL